jgi:Predicted membrane protein
MKHKEPVWLMILRIVLAIVFLFSGFSKAIDLTAASIQFDDYFISFGMGFLHPISMFCAFAMTTLEFMLGFTMLFKLKIKLTALGYMLIMIFMFFLTMWLALAEHLETNYGYHFGVVKDCGCFGEVIKMSNLQTFLKNVPILIGGIIVFAKRKRIPEIKLTELGQWIVIVIAIILLSVFQMYSYRHLPLYDTSDWKIGNNVSEIYIEQPDEKEMIFIYRNAKDSTVVNIPLNEFDAIESKIPDFYTAYEYVDRIDSVVQEGHTPKIPGFNMIDSLGSEHSFELISVDNESKLFLLFLHDLSETNIDGLTSDKMKQLIQKVNENGEYFVAVTNSTQEEINEFVATHQIEFPIYCNPIDPVTGPFMTRDAIRSNPGLILIEKGIVINKWSWRDIPEYSTVK